MPRSYRRHFHHLPRYGQLLYSPRRAHRRRLITMLGHTFGNLDNELRDRLFELIRRFAYLS